MSPQGRRQALQRAAAYLRGEPTFRSPPSSQSWRGTAWNPKGALFSAKENSLKSFWHLHKRGTEGLPCRVNSAGSSLNNPAWPWERERVGKMSKKDLAAWAASSIRVHRIGPMCTASWSTWEIGHSCSWLMKYSLVWFTNLDKRSQKLQASQIKF